MVIKDENKLCFKIFVECDCWSHAVELCRFHGEPEVYLSLWLRGFCSMPLLQRLKALWRILLGKTYCFEEVILSVDDAQKLKDYLGELLASGKERSAS